MKEYLVKFRCSPSEKEIIKALADRSGFSVSEYCRTMALKGKILAVPKLTEQEQEYFRVIKGDRTNWKRITNMIQNRDPALCEEIRNFLKQSEFLLNRFF